MVTPVIMTLIGLYFPWDNIYRLQKDVYVLVVLLFTIYLSVNFVYLCVNCFVYFPVLGTSFTFSVSLQKKLREER